MDVERRYFSFFPRRSGGSYFIVKARRVALPPHPAVLSGPFLASKRVTSRVTQRSPFFFEKVKFSPLGTVFLPSFGYELKVYRNVQRLVAVRLATISGESAIYLALCQLRVSGNA